MNSTSIGTGRHAVDLLARPAPGSDAAEPRGAAFDAMLGAALLSAARPPKPAPIAPPALDVTSFREDKVGDGDRSDRERPDAATAERASARDDGHDPDQGHRGPAARPADTCAVAMAGVLRPLIKSLASGDPSEKAAGDGSTTDTKTDPLSSSAQGVAAGAVLPMIVPPPVPAATETQTADAATTSDPGGPKADPAVAGLVPAPAAALPADFTSAAAVAALGVAGAADGKGQTKAVAGSAEDQERESTVKPASGPAAETSPAIDGARVISAETAGDRNAGTGKQGRDPSSKRGEQAATAPADPIPVAVVDDRGLPGAAMANRPNVAPAGSMAGAATEPVVAAAPLAEPGVPGAGRRDQVVLQLTDEHGDLGRIRVSVRGENVRATILSNDGALASRLTAEARSLERSLGEQGFRDARVTVQTSRPAADPAPIWNQGAKDAQATVATTKAQAGSRSQEEPARDSRDGERRDDARTRDQRGQRGQRARQHTEKEPQQ